MKKLILFASFFFVAILLKSQNVGVGTTTPVERLDVNGNINVTGTIKANGVDGTAGQVLMKNNSGVLTWADMSEYKNFVTFGSGSGTWTVPAGVTKIYIEAWGGGGGGSWYAGGGGGGYVCGIVTVTPGSSVAYTVGTAGTGSSSNGTNGGASTITYTPLSTIFSANGGFGATFNTTISLINIGSGGTFSCTGTLSYAGINGEGGYPSSINVVQASATAFHEIISGGHGGDAASHGGKGGRGAYAVFSIGTPASQRTAFGTNGGIPGGGGGSGYLGTIASSGNGSGSSGGSGMITIRI